MTSTKSTATLASILTLAAATAATAHPHIHILPDSTVAGAPLSIAHYGDANLAIVSGGEGNELHYGGSIYTVTADTAITAGDYAGFHRGAIINFAADGSDDLAATAGPVGYEIVDFALATGGATDATLAWRFVGASGNPIVNGHTLRWAESSAATAGGRSFLHNPGDHTHGTSGNPDTGFFLFVDTPGLFDVTVRAWDTSGYFTPSDTLTFRVNAIPEPATIGLVAAVTPFVFRRRVIRFH